MTSTVKSRYLLCKRVMDLALTSALLPFVLVVLGVSLLRQRQSGVVLRRFSFYGRRQKRYSSFTSDSALVRRSWRLWDIALGRISVVGPRMFREEDFLRMTQPCIPGVVCLHWLRQRTNVAFVREEESDQEYLRRASIKADVALLLRCLLACLYGRPSQSTSDVIDILGVRIDNTTQEGALRAIEGALDEITPRATISFVNADCLNKATRLDAYREALAASSMVLSDGIGLKIAGRLLGRDVRQNVNGTDLFPLLCESLNQRGASLYLYGARAEVIQELSRRIREQHPRIDLCGTHDGYSESQESVARKIAAARPDVLLVAMGAPHQELFLHQYREELGAKVALGVGGLFDFYSGRIPRAPHWMRDAGLEWVYRFIQEPGRMWKRYLVGNVLFLSRVLAEKMGYPYGKEGVAIR